VAEVGVQLRFFPWVELTDLLRLPADGRRFTSSQDLAVTSYEHTWQEGVGETSVQVRGKPSSGWYRWARLATTANPEDLHRLLDRSNVGPFLATVDPQFRGAAVKTGVRAAQAGLEQQWQVHVSPTAGFTPSGSTLKGASSQPYIAGIPPGQTQYAKLIPLTWNDARPVLGQPSEDIPVTAPYVEPLDLDPEKFRGDAPPNGSFESSFDGYASPPAHWSLVAGTWKTDVDMAPSDSFDGTASLQWASTSGTFGVRSAWFPVRGGDEYQAQFALRRVTGDGDVRMSVEWATRAKASLGTDIIDRNTTAFSAWGPVAPARLTAPGDAAFARVTLQRATTGTFAFRVDAVQLRSTGKPWRAATAEFWWASSDYEDYGGIYQPVEARIDESGRVFLRGLVASDTGSGGTHLLTLPVGLRPKAYELFVVITSKTVPGRLDVYTNGQVHLVTPDLDTVGDFVSLSGVSFDTR
jgi:hypothetical protein